VGREQREPNPQIDTDSHRWDFKHSLKSGSRG